MTLPRRNFLRSCALAAAAGSLIPLTRSARGASMPVALGIDNFAVRALGWKGAALIDYAAGIQCDTLFISDLESFESLEDAALADLKRRAGDAGLALYVGSWSICPGSTTFRTKYGTAVEHLLTGLRVAKALGSPVFRVVLGNANDRKTEGGIRARIAETVAILKEVETAYRDAGVRVAVENHAGDMHSWELADLVEAAGAHVGVNFDAGNATWTLEDPLAAFERLHKYVICSSLRDSMVWQTQDGVSVAWTAAGDGLIDWKKLASRWAEVCPTVPIMIETISGFNRAFPYKKPEFWNQYDRRADALAEFEAFAADGHPVDPWKAPPAQDKKAAEQAYQKQELEKSIRYLRDTIGLGKRGRA